MSVGRSLDQIAYLQGKIYAVASGYGTVSNLFERYDVEKNQWESLPNLAEALHGVSVVALGEKIYVIGGENESYQVRSDVRVYDPQTQNWSNAAPLPNPLFKAKAIAYDGAIYLINGASSGNFVNSCFRYSPETNNWSQLANAPFSGDGRKLLVYQDRIWAIGGFNSISSTSVSSVDSFDPRTNSWRAEASLTTPRNWPVAWVGNGGIYVGGGDNGAPLNTVEFYDRATKNWISNGTLPYALWWGGSIQSDGFAIWWGVPNQPLYFLTKSTRPTSLRRWTCTIGRIVLQAQLLLGS